MQQHPMHLGGRRCALPPNPPPAFLFLRMTPLTATPLPTQKTKKIPKKNKKNSKINLAPLWHLRIPSSATGPFPSHGFLVLLVFSSGRGDRKWENTEQRLCIWLLVDDALTFYYFSLICLTIVFWWYRISHKYLNSYILLDYGNTRRRCRSFIFNGDFFHIVSSLVDQGDASHAEKSAHTAQGPHDMRHAKAWRMSTSKALRKSKIFDDLWISWWFSGSRDTRTIFL